MMKKLVILYFLAFFCPTFLFAQVEMARSLEAIQDLKNGFLLVKLPTKTKQLAAYDAETQRFSSNLSHVEHLKKLRNDAVEEVKSLQFNIKEGFKNHYQFSEVVITYDTSKTIFYDKNMVVKEGFSLENKKYLIFNNQKVIKEDYILKDVFALSDKKSIILKYPFPSEIPIGFRRLRVLKYDKKDFPRVSDEEKRAFKPKRARKLDPNEYIAIVKMLDLRMKAFYNLVTLGK